MHTTSQTTLALAHRLLFDALVAIRAEGHEQKNKIVFHLADLFHDAVLDLQAAAEGELSYEEVLRRLEEKAAEKSCGRWLHSALQRIEANRPPGTAA